MYNEEKLRQEYTHFLDLEEKIIEAIKKYNFENESEYDCPVYVMKNFLYDIRSGVEELEKIAKSKNIEL